MSVRVVVVAALVCACRHSDVVADLDPLAAPSFALPEWFGLSGAPERRIAGQLLDSEQKPIVGVVHLRIDAPDATVWFGLDRETGADGKFDFGTIRPGMYTLFATAPGMTSRVIEADTRNANRGALPLYVHPCTRQWRSVSSRGGAPIAGARIDVAGTVIATTDANGAFEVCANAERITVVARAAGFAPESQRVMNTFAVDAIVLEPSIKLRGRVVGPRGKPLAGVAVQPEFVERGKASWGLEYDSIPVQVVSDREGRFVLRGIPEMDVETAHIDGEIQPAQYRVRVFAQNMTFENDSVIFDARSPDEMVVRPSDASALPEREELPSFREGTISGVVRFGDAPVIDAEVCEVDENERCIASARTRADGHFDLRVTGFGSGDGFEANLRIEHVSGLSGIGHAIVPAGTHVENMRIELARMSDAIR